VNLGARLETANKFYGTHLLISEATYQAAENKIEAREIDLITVKGKKKPVRVYEPTGKRGKTAPSLLRLASVYAEALAAYRTQNWKKAEALFTDCLNILPDDGPSLTFLKRMEILRKSDLPKNWDGVFGFAEK
jgi:adenylate cyclase